MTRPSLGMEQLNEMLKLWQERLGLTHWHVRLELVKFSRPWQSGDIKVDAVSQTALVLLSETPFRDEEETLVHELVHLVLWPLDTTATDLVEVIGPPDSAAREFAQSAVFRALEPVTEQLTRALLRCAGARNSPAWTQLEAEANERLSRPVQPKS